MDLSEGVGRVAEEIRGGEDSPVVLHVPHTSREIPNGARQRILLNELELAAELDRMTDTHTDLIAAAAA